jgi:hypothetical protein
MAMVNSLGLMGALTPVSSMRIILRARASINGQMEDVLKVNGRIIKWRGPEYSRGLTAENMKESI